MCQLWFISVQVMQFCVSGPKHSLISVVWCCPCHIFEGLFAVCFLWSQTRLLSLVQVPVSGKPKSALRTSERLLRRNLLPGVWDVIHFVTKTAETEVLLQPSKKSTNIRSFQTAADQTYPPRTLVWLKQTQLFVELRL